MFTIVGEHISKKRFKSICLKSLYIRREKFSREGLDSFLASASAVNTSRAGSLIEISVETKTAEIRVPGLTSASSFVFRQQLQRVRRRRGVFQKSVQQLVQRQRVLPERHSRAVRRDDGGRVVHVSVFTPGGGG